MKPKDRNLTRLVLMISGTIIVFTGSLFLILGIWNSETVNKEVPAASYTSEMNLNYSVVPKANMIYSEDVLKEELTYITEFVNQINTDFEYKIVGDSSMKVSGHYQISVQFSGDLEGETSNTNVWKKEKIIVPKTEFVINATGDTLNQRIRVNLGDYNSFAKTVIEASNIKVPVNAKVIMSGEAIVKNIKGEQVEPILAALVIPLDKAYFNIQKIGVEAKDNSIKMTENVRLPLSRFNLFIKILTIVIGIGMVLFGVSFKVLTQDEEKTRNTKKIFSNYGSRTAGVIKIPLDKIENMYEIKLIEDIVKIADELGKPILYEYEDNATDINFFCVVDGNSMYKYILHAI